MNFQAKPFLKWAGGKTKIVPLLNEYLGNEGRLIEPFVGSVQYLWVRILMSIFLVMLILI